MRSSPEAAKLAETEELSADLKAATPSSKRRPQEARWSARQCETSKRPKQNHPSLIVFIDLGESHEVTTFILAQGQDCGASRLTAFPAVLNLTQ